MALLFIIGVILWIWAEIAAFIAIGGELGVILTIIGIFVTAMIGMWLLRTQGRAVMASLQGQVSRGEAPIASMAAGVSILGGAVLMLIPGYLTDAAGLVMFMPVIRTIIGAALLKWVTTRGRFMMNAGSPFSSGPLVVDILLVDGLAAVPLMQEGSADRGHRISVRPAATTSSRASLKSAIAHSGDRQRVTALLAAMPETMLSRRRILI